MFEFLTQQQNYKIKNLLYDLLKINKYGLHVKMIVVFIYITTLLLLTLELSVAALDNAILKLI